MIYLISYDITDDKIRTKVAKILIKEGYERIQYSVFVGPWPPKRNLPMWKRLCKLCENETTGESQLFVLKVPDWNFLNMDIIGTSSPDLDGIAGKKGTMFF